jgi:hypothetical protein
MKVKISEIKANSKNPRIIKDDKFKKLVQSIREFPEMLEKRPLVCFTDVDNKYVVLGGNMRLKASIEVGLKELPIVLADDWTQEQRDEFLIKDNVGFGEWDWDIIANEFNEHDLRSWGLDLPVFDTEAINELEDENYIKISIKATNNAFIEMNEKLQNICDEYSAIMKVK